MCHCFGSLSRCHRMGIPEKSAPPVRPDEGTARPPRPSTARIRRSGQPGQIAILAPTSATRRGTHCAWLKPMIGRLLGKFPARTELVIDVTGIGKPVFEMFTYSGISLLGVLITAGTAETRDGVICGVPKLTLVSRLQALLHQGRLKIHRELAEAETLVRELQDFRVEFTAAGHLTFNARSGKHDDLVLALAIAVWRAHGGGMPSWGHFETVRCRTRRWRLRGGYARASSRDSGGASWACVRPPWSADAAAGCADGWRRACRGGRSRPSSR